VQTTPKRQTMHPISECFLNYLFDNHTDEKGEKYFIYMGRDKFENEDLIKYGWPEDLW
jgi:hypothetical protein